MNSIKKQEFIILKKALALTMLIVFGGYICSAQSVQRVFNFTTGDEFKINN
jgi:hypothetical protein